MGKRTLNELYAVVSYTQKKPALLKKKTKLFHIISPSLRLKVSPFIFSSYSLCLNLFAIFKHPLEAPPPPPSTSVRGTRWEHSPGLSRSMETGNQERRGVATDGGKTEREIEWGEGHQWAAMAVCQATLMCCGVLFQQLLGKEGKLFTAALSSSALCVCVSLNQL